MMMTTRATATIEIPVTFLGEEYFFKSNIAQSDFGIYRDEEKVLALQYE